MLDSPNKPKVKACTLFSGSSGNCIYIANDKTAVLVDIGVSCRKLERNMAERGIDPYGIQGILITHEHSDHIAGVSVFARKYNIPVYAPDLTIRRAKVKLKYSEKIDFRRIQVAETFGIGDFSCLAVHVSHDAIEPVAYKIDTGYGIVSVVTDTGFMSEYMQKALLGTDLIFLEANYDEDMLWNGKYSWPLKKRISENQGHLSNEQSAEVALNLLKNGTKKIVLIHLSKENNRPELAYDYITEYIGESGLIANKDYFIITAPRYEASAWQVL